MAENQTNPPDPFYDEPPESSTMQSLPSVPDSERDLVGAVLYDESAFDQADLSPADFYILRWRWVWEACEAIRAAADHIDYQTLQRALVAAGHWQDVSAQHDLMDFMVPTLLHVDANARLVRDRAERRRRIARAEEQARQAFDLKTPVFSALEGSKRVWTVQELAATQFPELPGPVTGLIPNGLTILGGRPKKGKSWLFLQASCSIASGGKFLDRELVKGRVRYYALEDRPKRLKDRLAKLGMIDDSEAQIDFYLHIDPLFGNGMAEIEQAARSGGYAMLVIDTLRRAMPGKDFNKDGALFDKILADLQTIAQQNSLAIAVILHTRKSHSGFDPDPVDDVLGSTGLTAPADQVLALYSEQGKKGATLKGRGRDLEDVDLALIFDPITCAWQSLGNTGEAKVKESEEEILDVLADLGKVQAPSLARTIGKDYSNTRKRMAALWNAGKIRREVIEGKTFYFLPRDESQELPTLPTPPT